MHENIIKFIAKIDDKESCWLVQNGTPIEIAEKMCLQFLGYLTQIKAQQVPQESPIDIVQEEPKVE